jgi:hypothetical protein
MCALGLILHFSLELAAAASASDGVRRILVWRFVF